MRHRFAMLTLILALAAPGLEAPDASARPDLTVGEPPELAILAQAVDAIASMHMGGFNDSTLWEAAIDGLIEALDDPYAELFTEDESDAWEESTTGNYSGIGLQITMLHEAVTVTAVFRSTPASEVGIIVGDVIVGVNTYDASEWTTDMAADSIRGPVGTDVLVKIRRGGFEHAIAFDITRAQVHVPAVHYGVLESGIGYVLIDRVARDAHREMRAALAELKNTQGLVIDLRRNPGGFLDESLMLADLFLKPGSTLASTVQRVAGSEARETETDSFSDRWPQLVPDLPIVVLVDRFTASGAEILAGALQDYDRALVMGERSFGKGVVQTVMPLPHNRRLRFTTGSWHTPLGRSLQRARDARGRPLAEDLDTLRRVTTAQGRTLVDGGGIFPDLAVADDTLTVVERQLIQAVNEQQVPLGRHLAELGFDAAAVRRETGADPGLTDEEFDRFMVLLEGEWLPDEQLTDPAVRSYLRWRALISVAQRMDDMGAETDFRMERDPVLAEAVRLLRASTSQVQLFQAADAEKDRRGRGAGGL